MLKGAGKRLADIKGQKVNLVELSVSHYLLVRALGSVGLRERDIKVVNTSDADIVGAFCRTGDVRGGYLETSAERGVDVAATLNWCSIPARFRARSSI